ncbi:hypothetical protein GALMADRAFT_279586 [Galerina marginata CBS 339.88]|uniref:Rhodopsin domain-containing protein n=1 Tax=Galerina marginata (strain CBS 339.88) TaxID=685588 RepID=A0A067SXA6_GALM3|nr:hypothetical protein GALMADRAFT_279586 [Galerina marginata CBS 339.88]
MALPPQNTLVWKVCMTVLQLIAIGFTIIRLLQRWRTSRMWWDDWVVVLALLADCLFLSLMWVESEIPAINSSNLLFSRWFSAFILFVIVWVSRISLAFSIARIFPPNHVCRRFAFGLVFLFSFLCVAGVALTFGICYKPSTIWFDNSVKECAAKRKPGGLVGVYFMMAFEFAADIALIVLPVTMLWRIQLPAAQRRLVLALFSSSVLSVLASIAFFTSLSISDTEGPAFNVVIGMTAQLQCAISLLVCNLLVVTMFFYRILQRRKNGLRDDNEISSYPRDNTVSSEKQPSASPSQIQGSHAPTVDTTSQCLSPYSSVNATFTSISDNHTPQSSAQLSSRFASTHPSMSFPSSYSGNTTGLSGTTDASPWSFPDTSHNDRRSSGLWTVDDARS